MPNEYGHLTTPSVVSIGEEDVYVGVKAKRMAAVDPLNTFYSVKRLIGQEMQDVTEDVKEMAYRTTEDDDGLVMLESSREDKGIYPEEISALVLSQLLEDAAQFKGEPITKAVISVPAYFNDQQREATVAAGMMAGLEKVRLLREPVAEIGRAHV